MEGRLQVQSPDTATAPPAVCHAANGAQRPVRLLDQVRWRIRQLHYSRRTEDAYVYWCRAFVRFHGLRHPAELGVAEVETFLGWLSNERQITTSTHQQTLSALLFLYTKMLRIDLPRLGEIGRPRTQRRLPVLLSRDEVAAVLRLLEGEHRLFAQLLYGTGMRIAEAQQLRVKDLDFAHGAVIVRCGKGGKDRVPMLPESLVPALRQQLAKARVLWSADAAAGTAGVYMPDALDRKYPRAGASWPWFWVFPQDHHSVDPRSGVVRRHHLYDQTFQRAFKRAVQRAGDHHDLHTRAQGGRWRCPQPSGQPSFGMMGGSYGTGYPAHRRRGAGLVAVGLA